jgi:alpha-1,6-mannosyltransferase
MEGRDDWRHTIVTPVSEDDPAEGTARVPGVALPFSGGYRLPLRRQACAQVLKGLRPSVIESGDPYRLAWASLDAARALQVPAVAFCHSNLAAMGRQVGGERLAQIAARYMRHLYRHFDLVLAPSESMRRVLVDLGIDRVERQPLGCDCRTFHPSRADATATGGTGEPGTMEATRGTRPAGVASHGRIAWKASLGLPPDTRVLVFAGRFAPEKHLDVLAAAVEQLGAPYVLLTIGAGPSPARPSDRVLVRPFERDAMSLARALASADAFIHAGDQETFGLAALEAMACGTPLIARQAAGLAELVDDTVGAPILGGTPDQVAQAVASLFGRGQSALAETRMAARRRAEAYDWNVVLPQLFARYEGLLSKPQPRTAVPLAASSPPLHRKL